MKLNININEENLSIQTDPEISLLELLRNQKLLSVKCGCKNHNCGSCAVLLDDAPVLTCKIPCGILRNARIVTLEHFSKTAVYQEIMKGFEKAGITLCGYCNSGKIFAAYEVLKRYSNPTREQVEEIVCDLRECCVENDTLINGMIYAAQIHFEKERLKKNGKQ
ncbi:MAG: 2Fe-2S iron-sulfur cluster binding domain-containing protein [Treponema sp.]|nr:2Fe-2S iron-sulfur cluster binding domain-containing protein [Treponema sp.]MBQ9626107.1 2Fe-2S iron-sulfur cluster binding domain-containing protein [Treponema sp.]